MKKVIVLILIVGILSQLRAQTVYNLYSSKIPGAILNVGYKQKMHIGEDGKKYLSFVSNPTITLYRPGNANTSGTSVIILPGGGYQVLAIEHEGEELAKRLTAAGITTFVLHYRLPDSQIMSDKALGPLQDAQEAIAFVKKNALKWDLDTAKIGIMGASAGGHLAAVLCTQYSKVLNPSNVGMNLRPKFAILLYPRISLTLGEENSSLKNLLGAGASVEQMDFFSPQLHVTSNTPPAFLVHASDDTVVNVGHSIMFYQQLIQNHIPAEMHLYQSGGHGFGLNNKETGDDWFSGLIRWLTFNKFK